MRDRTLVWGERTYVMGIVNVTPDSFSGDGVIDADSAAARAAAQHADGSDLLDIGAESTRPGHVPIESSEEIARLVPVLRRVRMQLPDAILSADTYKPDVLRAAHAAGADMLNSIWLLSNELLDAALACDVPIVIMHNQADTQYAGDVLDEVLAQLEGAARRAVHAGVAPDRLILDPGIGFGKTADQNVAVLRRLSRLTALGFPTLIGTSRKSMVGKLTGREPHERTYGTAATIALAIAAGIDIVRVHDVAAMRDVVRMSDAVVRGWRPAAWTPSS